MIWERLTGEAQSKLGSKPFTMASYAAGPATTAYVETAGVGDPLPEMPLFLSMEEYVNLPLEPTYQEAYRVLPRIHRAKLEA